MRRQPSRVAQTHLGLFLLALVVCLAAGARAKADGNWVLVTSVDGLLGRTVHVLSATQSDGMLVGTSLGLSHWEGARWVSYSAGNGLPPGYITAVAEWHGLLWAGSWGGGLGVLRGATWERLRAGSSPLPGDWVSALAADGDTLWVATYGRGLARLTDTAWTVYTHTLGGLTSDWLTCVLGDGRNGAWVGTERSGLAHVDGGGHWERPPLPWGDSGDQRVTALARRGGELWIGTHQGLLVLDTISGLAHRLGIHDGMPSLHVTALMAAQGGAMWVGTDAGLALCDVRVPSVFTVREGLPHDWVSALAVDRSGRVWVGSNVGGLAVSQPLPTSSVLRAPVVLVHGWRGPDSDRLEDSEFWHLARWLREDGFTPYYANGISPRNTLYANAVRLRDVIAQARRETGSAKVYLIAFSMGGLNARALMESTLYQGDVQRAFILGTPQRGEELWLPLLLWEQLAWTDDPSALELLPIHTELFSATHSNWARVPYTVIAGHTRSSGLPALFRELPASDGLVSTWSALGEPGPGIDRRVSDDLHAFGNDSILLDLPSLLYPRTSYDAHIRPYLFGSDDARGSGSPYTALGYARPETDPHSALRTGTILAGQVITLPGIPIDGGERSTFLLRWKGSPLSFKLIDPGGRAIKTANNSQVTDSGYLTLDFADVAAHVLTETLKGTWQMVVTCDAGRPDCSSQFVAYAMQRSPVQLRVTAERSWYRLGEWITVSAWLDDPQEVARLSQVTADVYTPSKQRETVQLVPTTSGHFVARYLPAKESGYYTFLVRASGLRTGQVMERGQELVVGVMANTASLTGEYRLTAEPSGQRDLVASVGIEVRQPGEYLLSVTAATPDGPAAIQAAHSVRLSPGIRTVDVPLGNVADVADGYDTKYQLAQVTLLDISSAAVLIDTVQGIPLSMTLTTRDIAANQ